MLKKLLILSCSFTTVSNFAVGDINNQHMPEPHLQLAIPEREMPFRRDRLAGFEIGVGLTSYWEFWEQERKIAVLKPWVKAAKTIKVRAPKETYSIKIHDVTTILDIKDLLQEDQGMFVEQQSINPVMPIWWTLGYLERKAAALDNGTLIKVAMDKFNTDIFELHLILRNQQQD